jgi:hypothetical protein
MPLWLGPSGREIWEFLVETERYILRRWDTLDLPGAARDVARRFLNRGGELLAGAVGLIRLHRTYAGPLFIRAMYELALQFEFLMQKPESRAARYLDYAHVTRYKVSTAVAENPTGPISGWLATSPDREEGEERNKAEYERVRHQFTKKGRKGHERLDAYWFGRSISELAGKLNRLGEYRVLYTDCSAWAHGNPLSTTPLSSTFGHPELLFLVCVGFYARLLLTIADTGESVLTSEQAGFLANLSKGWFSWAVPGPIPLASRHRALRGAKAAVCRNALF